MKAMDPNKPTIEKLNGSNYHIWKYKIELALLKEQAWDVVDQIAPPNPTAAWLRKDGKARATIGLNVENSEFNYIKKAKTAKESWKILKDRHEKPSLTNKISLLKKIGGLKMYEGGDMEEHLSKMNDLVEQLAGLGQDLDENLVVAMTLRILPDSYDSMINALELKPEEDLTITYVTGKLTDEYKRKMELKSFDHTNSEPQSSILKISTGGRNCNYCQKPGHLRANCFAYKKYLEDASNHHPKSTEIRNLKTTEAANAIVAEEDDGFEYLF